MFLKFSIMYLFCLTLFSTPLLFLRLFVPAFTSCSSVIWCSKCSGTFEGKELLFRHCHALGSCSIRYDKTNDSPRVEDRLRELTTVFGN